MSLPIEAVIVGSKVSYEDQANPRKVGTVVAMSDTCKGCDGRGTTPAPAELVELAAAGEPGGSRIRPPCAACLGTGIRLDGMHFDVEWDDGSSTSSDLRQHGWHLVAEGGLFDGADVISAYTRRQAIDDGTLVDVSEVAREAGFVVPVALTRAVWCDCVEWPAEGRRAYQDEAGRLWDVLSMARLFGRRTQGDRISFSVLRVPNTPDATKPRLVELTAVCGPGDTAEPVITVMLPGED